MSQNESLFLVTYFRVIAVPSNYFSAPPGIFGSTSKTVRLFGPDLKNDLILMRNLLKTSPIDISLQFAKEKVKELLPRIGSKRTHDLSIALYWELCDDSINLPDDFEAHERIKNYLENNEYGLALVDRGDLKAGVIGGNSECLIAIGPPNRSGQPGVLWGVFPKIDNDIYSNFLKCKMDRKELFADLDCYENIVDELNYIDRLQYVRDLMRRIDIPTHHINGILDPYKKSLIKEHNSIIAQDFVQAVKKEKNQFSGREFKEFPSILLPKGPVAPAAPIPFAPTVTAAPVTAAPIPFAPTVTAAPVITAAPVTVVPVVAAPVAPALHTQGFLRIVRELQSEGSCPSSIPVASVKNPFADCITEYVSEKTLEDSSDEEN
jgi:hypothetical protein